MASLCWHGLTKPAKRKQSCLQGWLSRLSWSLDCWCSPGFRGAVGQDAAANAPDQPQLRTWTDRSGEHQTEASLVDSQDGKVTLRKKDGTTITVSLQSLSDADREYVKHHTSGDDGASDSIGKQARLQGRRRIGRRHNAVAVATSLRSIPRVAKNSSPAVSRGQGSRRHRGRHRPGQGHTERLQPSDRANRRRAGRCGNRGQE